MYHVTIEKRVYKDLDRIAFSDVEKIHRQIILLQKDPRPAGFKKLSGLSNCYRLRQGNYRIVYTINDEKKHISIMLIRHRKDIYREMF